MLGDQSACLIPSSPVLVVASVSVSTNFVGLRTCKKLASLADGNRQDCLSLPF